VLKERKHVLGLRGAGAYFCSTFLMGHVTCHVRLHNFRYFCLCEKSTKIVLLHGYSGVFNLNILCVVATHRYIPSICIKLPELCNDYLVKKSFC
jgi:purine-nucleoside phosphorylase